MPDYEIGPDGQQLITSNTTADILLSAANNTNFEDLAMELNGFPAIIGQPFLTAALLMVDPENREFTLWQSNSTTEQNLIAVTSASGCGNPTATTHPNVTNPHVTSVPSHTSLTTTSRGLSMGVIAGIAIGGAVLLLGVIMVLRYWRRTRTIRREPPPGSSPVTESSAVDEHILPTTMQCQGPAEVEIRSPAELSGKKLPRAQINVNYAEMEGN